MPIDIELLTKAAKVYEASEAVDGEKPKEVYESHKKCAPGEFGMNKAGAGPLLAEKPIPAGQNWVNAAGGPNNKNVETELDQRSTARAMRVADKLPITNELMYTSPRQSGVEGGFLAPGLNLGQKFLPQGKPQPPVPKRGVGPRPVVGINKAGAFGSSAFDDYATTGLTGAGIGGIVGFLRSRKGKMLQDTLRGAGVGGAGGIGAAAALRATMGGPAGIFALPTTDQGLVDPAHAMQFREFTPLGSTAIGAGGAALGAGIANRTLEEVDHNWDNKKDDKDKKDGKDMKKESAYAFGMRFKRAFNLTPEMSYGAAGGGLLGAGLGGLAGFMNPGEEEDEDGRVRQRSRFGAALRGALGGGAAGALGGGALGYFKPNMLNGLRQMFSAKAPTGNAQNMIDETPYAAERSLQTTRPLPTAGLA